MNGNLIIKNAAELVTCSGFTAKKGSEMADLKIIENGTVLIKNGIIEAVGQSRDIEMQLKKDSVDQSDFDTIDARGLVIALRMFLDKVSDLLVFQQQRAVLFLGSVPAALPADHDTCTKSDGIDFLTHYFRPSTSGYLGSAFLGSSFQFRR